MKQTCLQTGGRRWRLTASGIAAALLALGAAGLASTASASVRQHPQPGGFNHKGDILIADQFNTTSCGSTARPGSAGPAPIS